MKKSKAYHLDIRAHRKNPYGLLRHSYREDGKVKKETICRSGVAFDLGEREAKWLERI